MKSTRNLLFLLLSIAFVVGLIVSCDWRSSEQLRLEKLAQSRKCDTLVMQVIRQKPEKALLFIDSLVTLETPSTERIAYYRALAYNGLGQKQKVEECCRQALDGNRLQLEDSVVFYAVNDLLVSTLIYRGDVEGALVTAQRGLEVSKVDRSEQGRYWTAVLMHSLGYCKMRLGKINEAENYFSQAYITLKQLVANDSKFSNVLTYARVSYNILDAYSSTGQYDKAKAWIESVEDAVSKLVASPECTDDMKLSYKGGLCIQKALALFGIGDRMEADASFQEALQMDYDQTDLGVLECAAYLEKTERWSELKTLIPRIDSLSKVWGDPSSLQHWEQYLENEK